ncbi:protein of unknown function [Taphrina deformans PYCC 5710]|uniref:50S ribosomal protein L35 n=1 Tax=Taphrina deformans (strain PYCC 5710 / ATCC 11124 / CBS 356.35 / IMI 108563 / JCM 9778 / NBRC 8474) TaxID=1097556 RepID=R4X6G4_TAPDE|nr:protein of unknown function [Taphrina deformans PYCC 5710]|eukprot:CCG80694.1 protein of unknown function [Taphrina deformans PYCC 5710]
MLFGSVFFSKVKLLVLAQTRGVKTHSATKKRWTALSNGGFKRGHAGARHGLFKKPSSRLSTLRGTAYANAKQKSNLRKLLPNG